MKQCKKCNKEMPSTAVIDGIRKSLTKRSYCLECSPWGSSSGYVLRKRQSHQYTDEMFVEAIRSSYSMRQVLEKLKLRAAGGNYKTIHAKIKTLKLDISHFTGRGHLRGKTNTWVPKIPLDEILIDDSDYTCTYRLKKRLLAEGLLIRECYNCGGTEWLGKPMPLELEHKNGKNSDHRLGNLELLCPNCHAFTPTYRGKNQKRVKLTK